jgi:hypothetical protein
VINVAKSLPSAQYASTPSLLANVVSTTQPFLDHFERWARIEGGSALITRETACLSATTLSQRKWCSGLISHPINRARSR